MNAKEREDIAPLSCNFAAKMLSSTVHKFGLHPTFHHNPFYSPPPFLSKSMDKNKKSIVFGGNIISAN